MPADRGVDKEDVVHMHDGIFSSGQVSSSVVSLFDFIDCSLPVSSTHEIFQARILEWIAISFSRESSQSGGQTLLSCIADRFFTI